MFGISIKFWVEWYICSLVETTFIFYGPLGACWELQDHQKRSSRILINQASLDAELNADWKFQIEIEKEQNLDKEKFVLKL